MFDCAGAVIVKFLVIVRWNIATREDFFKMFEESRIHRHHIFKMAVLYAIFDHQDLTVALDDLSLDLAYFFI